MNGMLGCHSTEVGMVSEGLIAEEEWEAHRLMKC